MRIEQTMAACGRPIPRRTPTSAPYFDAAREGRLVLQRCPRNGFFFYPRSRCPHCLGEDWKWEEVSGRGTLYSYTVDRVGLDPTQRTQLPLIVSLVELAEGPRLTSRVVDCAPEDIEIGMPLMVCFEDLGEGMLIHFRPSTD
ncbi:MAG: hypothetical protein CL908_08695 [Deltaproteobacteria bacterium]|nr:hypothetical protein [Deltaproteobacteria bacterium]